MVKTGSLTPTKIHLKTDPKQITFLVPKPSIPVWRRFFLLRYFLKLGEEESVTVNWTDYDLKSKKLDLNDEKMPYSPTLPTGLFKSVTQIFLENKKLITITFYYTTTKVLIQGNVTQCWVQTEFDMMHKTVNHILKTNIDNPDEIINSVPIVLSDESVELESATLSANFDKSSLENNAENHPQKSTAEKNKIDNPKDNSINADIIQTIHALENDHIATTTSLRSDIQAFKEEILDALKTLTGRVNALETKINNTHNDDTKILNTIQQDIKNLTLPKEEKAQIVKCDNEHFVGTLIELTSQVSKMENSIENIVKSKTEKCKEKDNDHETDKNIEMLEKSDKSPPKSEITVETQNRFELLGDLSDENQGENSNPTNKESLEQQNNKQPTVQQDNKQPTVDLWVIGSSVTRSINPRLMYRNKIVNVATLSEKTVNGAESYIRNENINAKVVLLQIGSNDLNRKHPNNIIKEYESLIQTCKERTDAQIVISGVLPRFQRDLNWRDIYEGKRRKFNGDLKVLAEKSECHFSEAPYIKEYDVYDGIHITEETGIPKLIKTYKRTTNALLGIQEHPTNPSVKRTGYSQKERHQPLDGTNIRYNKTNNPYNGTNTRTNQYTPSGGQYQNFQQPTENYGQYQDNYYSSHVNQNQNIVDYNHGYFGTQNESYKPDFVKQNNKFDTSSQEKLKWFLKTFIEELS